MSKCRRASGARVIQALDPGARFKGREPNRRFSKPTGVTTTKNTIPRTIGVVIFENRCASRIQAREIGPSRAGIVSPARISRMPPAPRTPHTYGRPRHQATAASATNAAPTVKANRRPSARVNRAGTFPANRHPPSIRAAAPYPGRRDPGRGDQSACA